MSLAPRLDLRQSQSLVMTPQLQQAIKLLALSNLEIEGFIAEEIEKQPAARGRPDRRRRRRPNAPRRSSPPAPTRTSGDAARRRSTSTSPPSASTTARCGWRRSTTGLDRAPAPAAARTLPDLDALRRSRRDSLADHLLAQAGAAIDGADLFIAAHLIDQIDEAGYLTAPLLDDRQPAGRAAGARRGGARDRSRPSTRPASARATWPNAWRSRRRRPTATIRAWRG